ncbi:phosphotransferase enzyme family protein [Paenibacillus agaridevorans]|uniref:phosphotransferase enzyme family protein n=1 Tax=Paenibacillus agaridevorans TaxID=171404 RepID=UPI001BE4484B|nr:aminoglycoside phosphotransferase family protein [Paenibacillus agaridevorans]
MGNPLASVQWAEKNEEIDALILLGEKLTVHDMVQGFEAEVAEVRSENTSFIWKVWNKQSKPRVEVQFTLLKILAAQGISVSRPLGWGEDAHSNPVLLTTFDGMSVQKVNPKKVRELAKLLAAIHRAGSEAERHSVVPKYDFKSYFFAEADQYENLDKSLNAIIPHAGLRQDVIIHGDYHLNNIVEDGERLIVIDWTNGQWGDARYDFAWSFVLMRIYLSERYAAMFRSAYLEENPMEQEELEAFEALGILRWLFLMKRGGTFRKADTIKRVKGLIQGNSWLDQSLL